MGASLFQIVEDAFCVLSSNGVYRQSSIYERQGKLYAKYGSGFIGLYANNGTTVPKILWADLILPVQSSPVFDKFGRIGIAQEIHQTCVGLNGPEIEEKPWPPAISGEDDNPDRERHRLAPSSRLRRIAPGGTGGTSTDTTGDIPGQ